MSQPIIDALLRVSKAGAVIHKAASQAANDRMPEDLEIFHIRDMLRASYFELDEATSPWGVPESLREAAERDGQAPVPVILDEEQRLGLIEQRDMVGLLYALTDVVPSMPFTQALTTMIGMLAVSDSTVLDLMVEMDLQFPEPDFMPDPEEDSVDG